MEFEDVLNTDDNRIMTFDYILETCKAHDDEVFTFKEPDDEKFKFLQSSANILHKIGYIKIFASSPGQLVIRATTEGRIFIENDSFEKQKEKKKKELKVEEEKLEHARVQHQVNEKALRSAKREPYLIAWSIISTLAAILISIFK